MKFYQEARGSSENSVRLHDHSAFNVNVSVAATQEVKAFLMNALTAEYSCQSHTKKIVSVDPTKAFLYHVFKCKKVNSFLFPLL